MELNAKTIMNRLQKETELLKPITPENSKKLKTVLVGMLSDLQQVCMDIGRRCLCAAACR